MAFGVLTVSSFFGQRRRSVCVWPTSTILILATGAFYTIENHMITTPVDR